MKVGGMAARLLSAGVVLVALAGCARTVSGSPRASIPATGASISFDGGPLPSSAGPSSPGPTSTATVPLPPSPTATAPAPLPPSSGPPSSLPPTQTSPDRPGGTVAQGALRLPVPSGLAARRVYPDEVCVDAPWHPCLLDVIDIGLLQREGASIVPPYGSKANPWYIGSDVPVCGDPNSSGNVVVSSEQHAKGLAPVGPHRADYGAWALHCSDGSASQVVRSWWLPTTKVYLLERIDVPNLDPQIAAMLRAATFI